MLFWSYSLKITINVQTYTDREIVELLRSQKHADRNLACRILEKKFKSRVMAWTRKQKGGLDGEDIFQSAILEFILAVQSHRYEPRDGVNMYSYFYLIMRSVWIRSSPFHLNKTGDIDWFSTVPEEERESPEFFTDYELKREIFMKGMEALDDTERGIVNAIFMEDRRLVDIVDEFRLKNYNNAKQKFLSIKKKMSTIFRNTQLFGN